MRRTRARAPPASSRRGCWAPPPGTRWPAARRQRAAACGFTRGRITFACGPGSSRFSWTPMPAAATSPWRSTTSRRTRRSPPTSSRSGRSRSRTCSSGWRSSWPPWSRWPALLTRTSRACESWPRWRPWATSRAGDGGDRAADPSRPASGEPGGPAQVDGETALTAASWSCHLTGARSCRRRHLQARRTPRGC